MEGVFAGGDVTTGPSTVISASQTAMWLQGINKYLGVKGKTMPASASRFQLPFLDI